LVAGGFRCERKKGDTAEVELRYRPTSDGDRFVSDICDLVIDSKPMLFAFEYQRPLQTRAVVGGGDLHNPLTLVDSAGQIVGQV
jgi:hypothetical protein